MKIPHRRERRAFRGHKQTLAMVVKCLLACQCDLSDRSSKKVFTFLFGGRDSHSIQHQFLVFLSMSFLQLALFKLLRYINVLLNSINFQTLQSQRKQKHAWPCHLSKEHQAYSLGFIKLRELIPLHLFVNLSSLSVDELSNSVFRELTFWQFP